MSQPPTRQVREMLQAAEAAHQRGDFEQAEALCDSALAAQPDLLPAWLMSAIASAKKGEIDRAVSKFNQALALDPNQLLAHFWLALLLRESALGEARRHAEAAYRLAPTNPQMQYALGTCLLESGEFAEARALFEKAISTNPVSAEFHFGRYGAMEGLGEPEEALKSLRRAVKYRAEPEWQYRLGLAELNAGNLARSRSLAEKLLVDEASGRAHYLLARVLKEEGRAVEMELELRRAIEMDPHLAGAHAQLGARLQTLGRFEEALGEYRTTLELDPGQSSVYYGICTSQRISESEVDLVERMEKISFGKLDPLDAALLEFGLGKAYQDLERPEDAMRHFDRANELSASIHFKQPFNKAAFHRELESKIRLFTRDFMDEQPSASESDIPILVVGMIRSGTTLMEHILSCHPEIGAGGEQPFWPTVDHEAVDYERGRIDFELLRSRVEDYLGRLQGIAPDKRHVTDKNPANVLELGLVHASMPNARIIHMRRHPVDTMLSIYMTAIRNPPPFACNRENIVFAYREYLWAVEHWRSVLPTNRFIEVDFESLVSDQRSETQRVLKFLRLDWDEACATPERNPRAVDTPSLWQVRQPIHRGSVKKWDAYRPWLGAFSQFLNGEGAKPSR